MNHSFKIKLGSWKRKPVAMLLEGISQGVPGTSQDSLTWDYRSAAMLLEGQEVPGTSPDTSEYVRNTLTSDGSPRYLCYVLDYPRLYT